MNPFYFRIFRMLKRVAITKYGNVPRYVLVKNYGIRLRQINTFNLEWDKNKQHFFYNGFALPYSHIDNYHDAINLYDKIVYICNHREWSAAKKRRVFIDHFFHKKPIPKLPNP